MSNRETTFSNCCVRLVICFSFLSAVANTETFLNTKNIDIPHFDEALQKFLPSSWINKTDALCLKKQLEYVVQQRRNLVIHNISNNDMQVRGSVGELLAVPVWYYSNPSDAIALEDVKRKQSDEDVMIVDYDEQAYIIKTNASRILHFGKCYPGYVQITDEPKYGKPVNFSAKEYRDTFVFCEDFSCDRVTLYSGAAATAGLRTTTDGVVEPPLEYVPAIPILGGWPLETRNLFIRKHPSGWPSKKLLDHIKTLHLFLVAKAHPESKNPDYEWRISFSSVEEKLALSLGTETRHVFIFIKLLFKSYFADVSPLSSYHLKMLLFNLVEERRFHLWIHCSVGENVLYFLQELLQCIRKRKIKSFFLPKSNLLSHIPTQRLEKLEASIVAFLSNPSKHILILSSSIQVIPQSWSLNRDMEDIIGDAVKAECSGRPITLQQLRSSSVYQLQKVTSRGQVMVAKALLKLGLRKEATDTLERAIYMYIQIGDARISWDKPHIPARFRKHHCGLDFHNVPGDFTNPIYEALVMILDNDMDKRGKYYRYSLKLLKNINASMTAYCSVHIYKQLLDEPYPSFSFRMRSDNYTVNSSTYICNNLMTAENMLLKSVESYDRRYKRNHKDYSLDT